MTLQILFEYVQMVNLNTFDPVGTLNCLDIFSNSGLSDVDAQKMLREEGVTVLIILVVSHCLLNHESLYLCVI